MQEIVAEIIGIEGLIKALSGLGDKALPALGAALYQEGEDIMRESSQNWVPVAANGGTLRGTGFVDLPKFALGSVSVRLHYGGGPARDYAVIQHENMEYNHRDGRRAKYLEGPFLNAANTMATRLADRLGVTLA